MIRNYFKLITLTAIVSFPFIHTANSATPNQNIKYINSSQYIRPQYVHHHEAYSSQHTTTSFSTGQPGSISIGEKNVADKHKPPTLHISKPVESSLEISKVEVKVDTPIKPAFDVDKPETWPKCTQHTDIVWASDGKCHHLYHRYRTIAATSAPEPASALPVTPSNHERLMASAGIATVDYGYVEWTINMESSWNPYAREPTTGACNLGQENPCGKSGCTLIDSVCELRWVNGYVLGRYGSWANEVTYHKLHGYY
jgi:hypothetical protein